MSLSAPKVTAVSIEPDELTKGKSEVKVTANITDDVGVREAHSSIMKPGATDASGIISDTVLTLSGDALDGKWIGSLVAPPSTPANPIPDGKYPLLVYATDDDGNYGLNFPDIETYLTISRGDVPDDITAPSINSVAINPEVLTKGASEVTISANLKDDVAVDKVWANIFESGGPIYCHHHYPQK